MAPQIVTRAQAGLQRPRGPYSSWPSGKPVGDTFHWEGAGGHSDHRYCAGEWAAIQLYHLKNGYVDIAYNWGVCQHGVVFEGRPESVQSAAQRDGNRLRRAIVFIGGPLTPFTQAAKDTMYWLHARHGGEHIAHRDEPSCSTSCAGDYISAWVVAGLKGASDPQPHPAKGQPNRPLPPGGVHHPTIRKGSVGSAITELQVKLFWGAGQRGVVPDGRFGPITEAAVRSFQRFFHLHEDGIAGPQTWGLLDIIVQQAQKH